MANWLTIGLFGYRLVRFAGALFNPRSVLEFIGDVLVEDDPVAGTTKITFDATGGLTGTALATPNTFAKRDGGGSCSFAGTCAFATVAASGAISCDSLAVATDATVIGTLTCENLSVGSDALVAGGVNADSLVATHDAVVGGDMASATVTCAGVAACDSLTVATDALITGGLIADTLYANGITAGAVLGSAGDATISGHCDAGDFRLVLPVPETRCTHGETTATPGEWDPAPDGQWVNSTIGKMVTRKLRVPHGAVLSSVTVFIAPAGSHAWPIDTYPVATVRLLNSSTGLADIATQADVPPDQATYEAEHGIVVDCGGITIDNSVESYHVNLVAEDGTNALIGTVLTRVEANWGRPAGVPIGQD